eukprot:609343-Ditylum_brightwellii.AAC.1
MRYQGRHHGAGERTWWTEDAANFMSNGMATVGGWCYLLWWHVFVVVIVLFQWEMKKDAYKEQRNSKKI